MRRFVNYFVFYATWVGMILGETYLWALCGFAIGFAVFICGGYALAVFHHRRTTTGEIPFGWPLKVGKWVTNKSPHFGLVANSFLNGAPGVGLVETAIGFSWERVKKRVIIAAVGYAGFWLCVHYWRPPGFIPIEWAPSLEALRSFWGIMPWS